MVSGRQNTEGNRGKPTRLLHRQGVALAGAASDGQPVNAGFQHEPHFLTQSLFIELLVRGEWGRQRGE